MFDLIGFWGNVTLLTAFAVVPFIWLFMGILWLYVHDVTGKKTLATSLTRKIWNWNLNSGGREVSCGEHMRVFNRFFMNEGWMFAFIISSLIVWMVLLIPHFVDQKPLITIVSSISQFGSGFTGGFFAVCISYLGSVYVGKKVYSLYNRVEKVLTTHENT